MADTGQIIGGYKLRGLLHTGRESQVWEVVEPTSNRHFAMKVLLPEFAESKAERAKLFNDAEIGMKLRHENVVHIVKVNRSPAAPHFIMEYFASGSIRRRLISRDPRDKEFLKANAKKIFKQTATGLAYMNASKFVHRDVKPDNIVLVPAQDDEGRPVEIVKVCDFGIAALGTTKVEEATAVGTPDYMAPEQSTGSAVAPSADVYACGCVLYEMLTGQVPFSADQAYRILMKHRNERPRAPSTLDPSIPAALEAIVLRCMEKLPERRYQSARELRVELRKLPDLKA